VHLGEVGGPVWVERSDPTARDSATDPGPGADVLPRLVRGSPLFGCLIRVPAASVPSRSRWEPWPSGQPTEQRSRRPPQPHPCVVKMQGNAAFVQSAPTAIEPQGWSCYR